MSLTTSSPASVNSSIADKKNWQSDNTVKLMRLACIGRKWRGIDMPLYLYRAFTLRKYDALDGIMEREFFDVMCKIVNDKIRDLTIKCADLDQSSKTTAHLTIIEALRSQNPISVFLVTYMSVDVLVPHAELWRDEILRDLLAERVNSYDWKLTCPVLVVYNAFRFDMWAAVKQFIPDKEYFDTIRARVPARYWSGDAQSMQSNLKIVMGYVFDELLKNKSLARTDAGTGTAKPQAIKKRAALLNIVLFPLYQTLYVNFRREWGVARYFDEYIIVITTEGFAAYNDEIFDAFLVLADEHKLLIKFYEDDDSGDYDEVFSSVRHLYTGYALKPHPQLFYDIVYDIPHTNTAFWSILDKICSGGGAETDKQVKDFKNDITVGIKDRATLGYMSAVVLRDARKVEATREVVYEDPEFEFPRVVYDDVENPLEYAESKISAARDARRHKVVRETEILETYDLSDMRVNKCLHHQELTMMKIIAFVLYTRQARSCEVTNIDKILNRNEFGRMRFYFTIESFRNRGVMTTLLREVGKKISLAMFYNLKENAQSHIDFIASTGFEAIDLSVYREKVRGKISDRDVYSRMLLTSERGVGAFKN